MNLILNNPYRILGLLVGANARQQTRQISRLRQFIEAVQKPDNDYSFDGLGDLDRTISSVETASSQLNLNDDKMMAALFWFYNGNKITDEPAFVALKDGDLDTCIAIWEKLIENGEVTDRNASAFNNLGTFYMSLNVKNSDLVLIDHPTKGFLSIYKKDKDKFKKGIALKLQFLESDFAHKLKALATDETYNFNQKELQLLFLNQLQTELEASQSLSKINFLGTLNRLTFLAKDDYLKNFITKPIQNIEQKIDEAERKSKANKAKAGDYGNELFNATNDDFALIKSILPNTDIKLINIADKLAEALVGCSIDVFNHFHGTETEVGEIALELNNKAKSIAIGNQTLSRINESIPIVQEYIKGKTERQQALKTKTELDKIASILQIYNSDRFFDLGINSIEAGRKMINECKPYLMTMKHKVGQTDDIYITISSGIASKALGYLIAEVNLSKNKESVKNALSLIDLIYTLDFTYDFKVNRLAPNKATLENMLPKPGCYIATMAYGDYDHPQVMILRGFRDNILDKSVFGKWFIKTYYKFSPQLVERLKNKPVINILIRKMLNQFIKLIK